MRFQVKNDKKNQISLFKENILREKMRLGFLRKIRKNYFDINTLLNIHLF